VLDFNQGQMGANLCFQNPNSFFQGADLQLVLLHELSLRISLTWGMTGAPEGLWKKQDP